MEKHYAGVCKSCGAIRACCTSGIEAEHIAEFASDVLSGGLSLERMTEDEIRFGRWEHLDGCESIVKATSSAFLPGQKELFEQ